ncbi:hypothetical protein AK973_2917 [Pseudomonas brassicacearum]|nr:hypothetical protein AK973_2917 [Pseudomonas brassicacearum]
MAIPAEHDSYPCKWNERQPRANRAATGPVMANKTIRAAATDSPLTR